MGSFGFLDMLKICIRSTRQRKQMNVGRVVKESGGWWCAHAGKLWGGDKAAGRAWGG